MLYFSKINTNRLLLRQLREDDAVALIALRSDPIVNPYLDRAPPVDIAEIHSFIGLYYRVP
jgi:RimJ/RimL family protein N-acetyltransferase